MPKLPCDREANIINAQEGNARTGKSAGQRPDDCGSNPDTTKLTGRKKKTQTSQASMRRHDLQFGYFGL